MKKRRAAGCSRTAAPCSCAAGRTPGSSRKCRARRCAVECRSAGTLGGWGLGVSTYSRHRSLAMEFIRAITSPAGQRALCAPTGYAPALKAAYADPELLGANAFLAELERLHENAVLRPPIPRYALASDILQRHLSAVRGRK